MDIHRLEVFCKIVELRSFTRAAEALSLAQPTVSEHIRGLEDFLGEKLLERIRGDVKPTPVGQVFYQYARHIIQLRNEALQTVHRFRDKLSGNLLVGASTIPGTYLLPRLIASFAAAHSQCQIELKIWDTHGIVEGVATGSLEAGVVGAKVNNKKVIFEEILEDELVLAAAPDHRWARSHQINPQELLEEPFIVREKGSGTWCFTSQILEQSGLNPGALRISARMDTTESVRQGIKAGIGVSILSRRAIDDDLRQGSLVAIEVSGIKFPRVLYLVFPRKRQLSPLCSAFLNHVRAKVKTLGAG
ncbi:MAG: LysR family transcriptional regulator [Desulfomonile sp.]|nr:LysR family transcriptional regulator [Desulfomonile sp.]